MRNRLKTDMEGYVDFIEKKVQSMKIMCGRMTREKFYLWEKYEMFCGGNG